VFYRYEFTDAAERIESGRWWTREQIGVLGPMSLRDFVAEPDVE
jgi:hypothetical protein